MWDITFHSHLCLPPCPLVVRSAPPHPRSSLPIDLQAANRRANHLFSLASRTVTEPSLLSSLSLPSTYSNCHQKFLSRHDDSLTRPSLAKLQSIVNASQKALSLINNACMDGRMGGSLPLLSARQLCPPASVDLACRAAERSRLFAGPFLHGPRYTSYGRHFTNPQLLNAVARRIEPYVDDGDAIVDFCCGANHFSKLAKHRLRERGKRRCQFRNFDLFRPADEFCFQQVDWLKTKVS